MAQNCGTAVFVVQKFIHEEVHNCTERIDGEVTNVFSESKECEGGAKTEMGEGRL